MRKCSAYYLGETHHKFSFLITIVVGNITQHILCEGEYTLQKYNIRQFFFSKFLLLLEHGCHHYFANFTMNSI